MAKPSTAMEVGQEGWRGSEAVIRERVREIIKMVLPEEMAGLGAPRAGG
ncbi:MAG: hypothetical protein WB795_12125 [Candidatus Acidiferrales bacterium]